MKAPAKSHEKKPTSTAPCPDDLYVLRLYVSDSTPKSTIALRNLTQLCEKHLAGCYTIEVIDLFKHPERAKADQILAVPTLVRELPSPIRKFIGTLTDPERVLIDFKLRSREEKAPAAEKRGGHV